MKKIKKLIFKILFGLEIIIFSFTYLFGSNGVCKLVKLNNENKNLRNINLKLKTEIEKIENQMKNWHSDSFYAEKIAREQLQMAKKDEQIYLIT